VGPAPTQTLDGVDRKRIVDRDKKPAARLKVGALAWKDTAPSNIAVLTPCPMDIASDAGGAWWIGV